MRILDTKIARSMRKMAALTVSGGPQSEGGAGGLQICKEGKANISFVLRSGDIAPN